MRVAILILALMPGAASAAPMLPILPGLPVAEPAAPTPRPDPCDRGCAA